MNGIDLMPALYGRGVINGGYLMLFSMRLDETGTDGVSKYMAVGGAVATVPQWSKLESKWDRILAPNASAFHLKEFDARNGEFEGWSDFKAKRFEERLTKAIEDNTAFRATVGIDRKAHADIKQRMLGIKGFRPDSDYSLCLRFLMFQACEQLCLIDPDCRLALLVESGPWAAGASETYEKVAAMQGKWRPAKHAHRLAGFAHSPKHCFRSLEAADLIVGRECERLIDGRRSKGDVLAHLLTASDLEIWYEKMMDEKGLRRAWGNRDKPISNV